MVTGLEYRISLDHDIINFWLSQRWTNGLPTNHQYLSLDLSHNIISEFAEDYLDLLEGRKSMVLVGVTGNY